MKKRYITFLFLLFTVFVTAQEWEQHVVSNTLLNANNCATADIDLDGDMDLLGTSGEDYHMYWYENLDGEGNFGSANLIDGTLAFYIQIEWRDLDNDNDPDLLFIENNPSVVAWKENLGQSNFGPTNIIIDESNGHTYGLGVGDLDSDNDDDLLLISNGMYLVENMDGNGTWGTPELIIEEFLVWNPIPPNLVDIDLDGHLDIMYNTEEEGPAEIIWYRNLGDGTFAERAYIYSYDFFQSDWTTIVQMDYVDLDTDGKKDIVVLIYHDLYGYKFQWLRNIDNSGQYQDPIDMQPPPIGYQFADLDNDTDLDIISYSVSEDRLDWYRNETGNADFSQPFPITTLVEFPRAIGIADMNGDERPDVFAASIGDDSLTWYNNPGNLTTDDFDAIELSLYPNPAQDKVFVETKLPLAKVRLVNALGQAMDIDIVQGSVDVSALASGIYLLEATFDNGQSQVHRLLIR